MLPSTSSRLFVVGVWACLLAAILAAGIAPSRADDLKISAALGIGGRYRPGNWLPVTVSIVNTGADPIHGQVQLYAADSGGNSSSLFARPADVAANTPTPQSFQVYTRGLDPAREDVVAQLVSGAGRGDGGVLAKVSTLSTAGRNSFTGNAISDTDLFLVGVSADPAAFNFLSGQKWGLMHTESGLAPEAASVPAPPGPVFRPPTGSVNPASVQSITASPGELPDKPAGYGGVDAVLLRADAPLDSLTEAQTDALRAWVASGGHLIVCGGADPTPLGNAFFNGLLPAGVGPSSTLTIAPAGPTPALTLTPKPLPGVRVVSAVGGRPAVVSGPYGAGRVTLAAFDPALPAFRNGGSPAVAAFWKMILLDRPSVLLNTVAAREQGSSNPYGWGVMQLSDAVMRAPALDAPGAGVVGLFLLAYVLILVPVNYLVLKRLDKKEWAWVTVPILVLLFAVTTYGVGYAAKGSRVFVNRAAILETTAGERPSGLYTEYGLFSPHRTTYDLTVSDPNALAAIPAPAAPEYYGGQTDRQTANAYGQTRFVQSSGDAKMLDTAVNMWAMRSFDVQTSADWGGTITSSLARNPQTGLIHGIIANQTPHALTECHLFLNGQWQALSDLPPGAAVPVTAYFPVGAGGALATVTARQWAQMPTIQGRNDKNDPESDVRQRMRAALADFVRDLGNDPTNGQYYGPNYTPPAVFQPRAGEAILTGWSTDGSLAGPALRVDGHAVTENNVTFVVVHIPLR